MKHFHKSGLFIFALIQLVYFPDKAWTEPIPVFVSIVPQKYFVERIGREQVKVEVMVNSGESPATFNPNPKKMSLLSKTELYFSIGVPFETTWIDRIRSIHPELKIIPLHDTTQKNTIHEPTNHHSHDTEDPHIWTSPAKVKVIAQKIKDTLANAIPQREKYFEANLQAFFKDLDLLDKDIRNILTKSNNHRFMVFHPAWSYFAKDYDLKQIAIEHEGKEPGARSLKKIIEQGKSLGIQVIFVQKQFSLSIAENVAKMIGATIYEMDPLAEDYLENMRRTASAISGALQ
jgi:zinc transport system substrate-binding protein